MTDVPYGRGGSPLQNLIVHGHTKTRVSALRMVAELDAGPVYLKRPLDLSGRAQEIFERLSALVFDMIEEIVGNNPEPVPQTDEPVVFNRRTPAQSVLPAEGDLKKVYDHIRMLDAETYPRAFLENGDYRLEFSHARLCEDGALWATVTITEKRRDEK
jgi:methionyl-tRNA formyltransferase